MIVAEIYQQRNGKIVGFVLTGHNETEKRGHGYNIHCAEVSMLSSAAYISIRKYLGRDAATENNAHGGLGLELQDAPDDLTEAVFQIMLIGLREIEKINPKVIKIQTIRIDAAAKEKIQHELEKMTPSQPKPLPKVNVEAVCLNAEMFHDTSGQFIGFSVAERAGKRVEEQEIYCAAAWAMTKATFACLRDHLRRNLEIEFDSRLLSVKLSTQPDDLTEAVFQTMFIGMSELEKLAPKVIRTEKILFGGETK